MDAIIQVIERSNQRGGRMLSVVDLVEAGTLSLGQAAWLVAEVQAGSSWLVGAKPGGAGKTAVMSALLGVLPPVRRVWLTNPGTEWGAAEPGDCVVAYEISPGSYDAYIWGQDVRQLAELGRQGVRIVTNLHADTLQEAQAQVVDENGVTPDAFAAFGLFIPIQITGSMWRRQREVQDVYRNRGEDWRAVSRAEAEQQAAPEINAFLEDCLGRGCRHVDDVRRTWLEFLARYEIRDERHGTLDAGNVEHWTQTG